MDPEESKIIMMSLCMEDIANAGFDTTKISDTKFEDIFKRLKNALENSYSYSLVAILRDMKIPESPLDFEELRNHLEGK